jgi:hypothetical protein
LFPYIQPERAIIKLSIIEPHHVLRFGKEAKAKNDPVQETDKVKRGLLWTPRKRDWARLES